MRACCLACRLLPSQCTLTWWRERGISCLSFSGHSSHLRASALLTSPKPYYLPQAPPPGNITLGGRTSTYVGTETSAHIGAEAKTEGGIKGLAEDSLRTGGQSIKWNSGSNGAGPILGTVLHAFKAIFLLF